MKKTIIYLMLATAMSSCGIYSNYKRPDNIQIDGLYGTENSYGGASDTSSVASLSWKELFTDPHLQGLINEGLEKNTDLRIAYLKVSEAEAALMSSRLAFLPSLNLDPQGALSSFDGAKPTKTYSIGASASWEMDFFGKLRNSKKQARAQLEQSRNYSQAVQTQLIATIANDYYTLLMLDEQIGISEKTLHYWEENVRVMKALKLAGKADEQAVAQSEANCASMNASLLNLRQQVSNVQNSLSALLGRTPGAIGRGKLDEQRFPSDISAGVPLALLSNRPDIRQSEAILAECFYATNEARSAFYPSVTLSGTAGWTNNSGLGITDPGKWLLNAVGSLVQPLFNKGTNVARLKIAKAQQQEALLSFQQNLLNAGTEVNNSLTAWQTARQRLEYDNKQIRHLQTALRSAELTMQYGNSTYLEVLSAQQALLQAELSAVQDRFDEIEGVIDLYHALGGGVK